VRVSARKWKVVTEKGKKAAKSSSPSGVLDGRMPRPAGGGNGVGERAPDISSGKEKNFKNQEKRLFVILKKEAPLLGKRRRVESRKEGLGEIRRY